MDAGMGDLSRREREVLDLIATGQSNKQIAEGLGISAQTVANHTMRLYAHLGIDPWECNPRVVAAVLHTRAALGAGEEGGC